MGYALYFRSNNTTIISYSRNSKMMEALNPFVHSEEWTEATGLEPALYGIEDAKSSIERSEAALKHFRKSEDIYQAVDHIQYCKDELRDLIEVQHHLQLLIEIQESLKKEGRTDLLLEYRIY